MSYPYDKPQSRYGYRRTFGVPVPRPRTPFPAAYGIRGPAVAPRVFSALQDKLEKVATDMPGTPAAPIDGMGDNYEYTRGSFSSPKAPWAVPWYARTVGFNGYGYGLGGDITNPDDVTEWFANEITNEFTDEIKKQIPPEDTATKNLISLSELAWKSLIKEGIKIAIRPAAQEIINLSKTKDSKLQSVIIGLIFPVVSIISLLSDNISDYPTKAKNALTNATKGLSDKFINTFLVQSTQQKNFLETLTGKSLEELAVKFGIETQFKEIEAAAVAAPRKTFIFSPTAPQAQLAVPSYLITTLEADKKKCEQAGGIYERHMTDAGPRMCRGYNVVEVENAKAKCVAGGGFPIVTPVDVGSSFICRGGSQDTQIKAEGKKFPILPVAAAAGIAALLLLRR